MTPESVMVIGMLAIGGTDGVSRCWQAALVTGLIISILQAATRVNEMTMTFIRKS